MARIIVHRKIRLHEEGREALSITENHDGTVDRKIIPAHEPYDLTLYPRPGVQEIHDSFLDDKYFEAAVQSGWIEIVSDPAKAEAA